MSNKQTLNTQKSEKESRKNKRFPTNASLILFFMKGSMGVFLASIFFGMLVSLTDLSLPKIIQYTVDSVIGDQPLDAAPFVQSLVERVGGIAYLKDHLGWIAAAVILVALIGAICRYLFRLLDVMGAERLTQRMRDQLFGHLLHLPYIWHGENHTGDIIQRCTSDVDHVKVFISEQMTQLVRVILLIVLSLYFMIQIHLGLAIAAGIFIPLIVFESLFFYSKIGGTFQKVDVEEGKLSDIAQENLTGVRVVRAFGREEYERERFEKQDAYYTGLWVHLMKILGAFWVSGDIIAKLRTLTVVLLGSWFCISGSLTPGGFLAFISYNSLLSWPVRSLGRVISEMSKANISIDRLAYIMNAEEEKDIREAGEPDLTGDIDFDHVSFTYENGTAEVLSDVSFHVKSGTTVGILGSTGSGKSSLMYLLNRMYDLEEGKGQITIGGKNIRTMKRDYLRRNIGMVLQEPYLFSRTLSENIRIASKEADMKEIRQAAKIASLDDTIESFSEGYETFVGERGVTLSGGQKQRTAIAQMLIRKPPIMVFDDSLSAVDAETDVKIRRALKENVGEATVFLIAHRITTLMAADQIIVMDKGRVVQKGTHEDLIKVPGMYRDIYDLQMKNIEEARADEKGEQE